MMILDKYISKMDDYTMVKRYTIVELAKRGYGLKRSREIFNSSGILDIMNKDPEVFLHYDEREWADIAIERSKNDSRITA